MRLLIGLLCLILLSHCSVYQVQVHNRSMFPLNYKQYTTTGSWENRPAKTIYPMTWSNAASTGTFSSLTYIGNLKTASVQFGRDGVKCDGCGCSVTTVSSTFWKVYFSC
ncbi:hypothetical protein GEMRC1_006664 [Eukaryota sp. GEM-RC1]